MQITTNKWPDPMTANDNDNITAHAHTSVNLHEFVFEAEFYSCHAHGSMVREIYTVQSKILGMIF
jgi:hypothetical protein